MSLQYIADFESKATPNEGSGVLAVQWASANVVLTGHLDGWLRAWRASDGALIAQVQAHPQSLSSLTASRDGSKVLSSSIDGSTALWNTASLPPDTDKSSDKIWNAAASTSQSTEEALVSCLHPHLPLYAVTGRQSSVSLLSADEGTFGRHITTSDDRDAPSNDTWGVALSFSPAGNLLALGTSQGHVVLYRLEQEQHSITPVGIYKSQPSVIRALAFDSFDGKENVLFVSADDGAITLYDVRRRASSAQCTASAAALASTNSIARLTGHKGVITRLAPVPLAVAATTSRAKGASQSASRPPIADSHQLLSSTSSDGTVRIWDLRTVPKSCVFVSNSQGSALNSVAWRPPTAGKEGGPASSGFVVGSRSGQLTWFRLAGSGAVDL